MFVGLVILLLLHGTNVVLASWIGILLICRVVEQMANFPQLINNNEFKSFVKKVYLNLPEINLSRLLQWKKPYNKPFVNE